MPITILLEKTVRNKIPTRVKERIKMYLKEKTIVDLNFVNRLTEQFSELPITSREKEILIQLAQGKTNREISQKLMLSPSTVRNHISSIFTKLRISNRSQATAVAIYSGLLKPQDEKNHNQC